jgi:proline iminopeptidase
VLRGIFLFDQYEIDWMYRGRRLAVYPDKWDEFVSAIPESTRRRPVEAIASG